LATAASGWSTGWSSWISRSAAAPATRRAAARGIATDPALMSDEMTELRGYRAAREMLADDPPTAFLASSMISGLGVRRAVEEMGLRWGATCRSSSMTTN
jgi:DNA-binding LacI/PurR family transcriptional regulator